MAQPQAPHNPAAHKLAKMADLQAFVAVLVEPFVVIVILVRESD